MKMLIKKWITTIRRKYWLKLLQFSPILYIKQRYFMLFGRKINLENPRTFAEKIQWLKCYDRDERIIRYADKFLVREFVAKTIGEKYLIPLICVYNGSQELCYEALPNRFVLKPNNSSGRVLVCKDKSMLQKENVLKAVKEWENENLTALTGEWVYEKIPYKLICEEFLEDQIVDYKMYFAGGEFICTQVIVGRSEKRKKFGYFDAEWNLLDIKRKGVDKLEHPMDKPDKYGEMLQLATKLAQGFIFIRVDLYCVGNRVYFGELSFYPNNGFVRYETDEMDNFFASKIRIPDVKSAMGDAHV